ncbi:mannose-6-phosphate isomerase, class I [Schaalia naturae]|uniref:mannose-6-phosphate isomerase n=1 Tax=Schaalia naturae TaxID=635203 RepID=A0ABW2SQE4_9ACTO
MLRLTGVPQYYDWGSPSVIPEFLGRERQDRPLAELWFGAHPHGSSPSVTVGGGGTDAPLPLGDRVDGDPEAILGTRVARSSRGRFPFLVKLLAARRGLSIQAHPTREQVAQASAQRHAHPYPDQDAKPEALLALAPVRALAGTRTRDEVIGDLSRLPSLSPVRLRMERIKDETLALHVGLRMVLTLEADLAAHALGELAAQEPPATGDEDARSGGPLGSPAIARRLLSDFPGDRGVIASLFLRPVSVEAGQALCLRPGVVHAYLEGFGIEVMANSDNVVRAGLTGKAVDVDEFLRIAALEPAGSPVVDLVPRWPAPGVCRMSLPMDVGDFAVEILDLRAYDEVGVGVPDGPMLVLDVEGLTRARGRDGCASIGPGEAVLAGDGEPVALSGVSRVAIVTVPSA